MDEAQVRSELDARIRAEMEPIVQGMQQRHDQEAAMSDEEWRAHVTQLLESKPEFLALPEERRELFYQRRQMRLEGPRAHFDAIVKKRVDEVLPSLLVVRQELKENGPLTDDQYDRARLRATVARADALRQLMSAVLQNMAEAIADLTGLNKPTLDEQDSEWLASRAAERAAKLKAATDDFKHS